MKDGQRALDAITDKVLSYQKKQNPKPSKPAAASKVSQTVKSGGKPKATGQ